jgi:hypothetical protein
MNANQRTRDFYDFSNLATEHLKDIARSAYTIGHGSDEMNNFISASDDLKSAWGHFCDAVRELDMIPTPSGTTTQQLEKLSDFIGDLHIYADQIELTCFDLGRGANSTNLVHTLVSDYRDMWEKYYRAMTEIMFILFPDKELPF